MSTQLVKAAAICLIIFTSSYTTEAETDKNDELEDSREYHHEDQPTTVSYRYGFPDDFTLDGLRPGLSDLLGIQYNEQGDLVKIPLPCSHGESITEECVAKYIGKHLPKDFDMESRSVIYNYMACWFLKGAPPYCPDPCHDKCGAHTMEDGVSSGECITLNSAVRQSDYMCKCPEGRTWDAASMDCDKESICGVDHPCHPQNSESCELTDTGYTCQCSLGYSGEHCDDVAFNACRGRRNPSLPSGDEACFPGVCEPWLGRDVYTCDCGKQYTDDWLANDYPDCEVELDACTLLWCDHGSCRPPDDESEDATCVCDKGYGGQHCSQVVQLQSDPASWNQWSPCQPSCGEMRTRVRVRTCEGGCIGEPLQNQQCLPHPCLVDGVWSAWTDWTSCNVPCGGGNRVRTRMCHYNLTSGFTKRGMHCEGDAQETIHCNTHLCNDANIEAHAHSHPAAKSAISLDEDLIESSSHHYDRTKSMEDRLNVDDMPKSRSARAKDAKDKDTNEKSQNSKDKNNDKKYQNIEVKSDEALMLEDPLAFYGIEMEDFGDFGTVQPQALTNFERFLMSVGIIAGIVLLGIAMWKLNEICKEC